MLCTLALTLCTIAAAETLEFTPENFVLIENKPRLIIGLYENPEDDAVLAEAADAGFNFVRAKSDQASLDRLHRHGVYAWIPLGGNLALKPGGDAGLEKLAGIVNDFKNHPALLSWEAPDESLWNQWYCAHSWIFSEQPRQLAEKIASTSDPETAAKQKAALDRAVDLTRRGLWQQSEEVYDALWKEFGMEPQKPDLKMTRRVEAAGELCEELNRGWELVRQLDKDHVLWQNHAPRNSIAGMRAYNRLVDAAGCDIYPVPANYKVGHSDLPDKSLTSVGAYTDRMRDAAPGRACWMVLQGFGWRDIQEGAAYEEDAQLGRRPTWQETRFMAYNSLLHGANAVLYWGTAYIEKDSNLWRYLLRLARELRALEPAIVAPKPAHGPVAAADETYASFDGGQPLLMFRKYAGPGGGDEYALIALNECYAGIAFDVAGLPPELEGRQLYRLYSEETVTVRDGGFRDGIQGYDVHVYATSKKLQAE